MASYTRFSILFLSSAYFVPYISAFTQCYYPDGSIPRDYRWEPCVGTGHSSCCIPTEGDVCQPNGLCWYPRSNNTFRGTCTDRTWNDPSCPKDLCVQGNEDTWAWSSPCAQNDTSPSKPDAYACGTVSDDRKVTGLCPSTAPSTYRAFFVTTTTTTSKPTRYTAPPPLDTAKFSLYTETYTATVSAWVQTTTFATTYESTFTSTLGLAASTSSTNSAIGSQASMDASSFTPSTTPRNGGSGGGINISPGVLGAAIGAPIVGLGIIAWLLFYLRAKRAIKKGRGGDMVGSERLDSSGAPPENGPVGDAQVRAYEVPATEARPHTGHSAAGYYGEEKRGGVGVEAYEKSAEGVYEMGSLGVGEKNASLYARSNGGSASPNVKGPDGVFSPVSPMSPAPAYGATVNGPVELDGGNWGMQHHQQQLPPQRPVGSNRIGVGNA